MPKVSEQIKAVVIGPGAGEHVYRLQDTGIKPTLTKLFSDYPNLEKVSLVLGWFGDSMDADKISISPRIESLSSCDAWNVGTYNGINTPVLKRGNAWTEGTPDDADVIELVKYLNERNIKVTLYPMLFIDDKDASWRGFISAKTPEGVKHFFAEYNKFILHYATLLKGSIETLIIGSEMEALTKFRDDQDDFLAVNEFINLAKITRGIVGSGVKLTYAANWSEYHHTDGGWYHLDKLWADNNIDFVGIDAYFPITDEPIHGPVDPKVVAAGWTKGRDFDYYVDGDRKIPMDPTWGSKNFIGWWQSNHYNPDGIKSDWQPKMKPIAFTEVGFSALDAATNEPYKYWPDLPEHSNGEINPQIQYNAIAGTLMFLETLKQNPETAHVMEDVYWYNIFPTGYGEDYASNHELKIAWVESVYQRDVEVS